VQADLDAHIHLEYGTTARDRYWDIFEELRGELGYADYVGALERYRREAMHNPRLLRFVNWLADYPFADRLYRSALNAVKHVQQWAPAVILSDGDAVFQPRKVERSGLWQAFDGHVLIYIHKEEELADVERLYPANHYVMIDDKLRILDSMKKIWGDRLTALIHRIPGIRWRVSHKGLILFTDWVSRPFHSSDHTEPHPPCTMIRLSRSGFHPPDARKSRLRSMVAVSPRMAV